MCIKMKYSKLFTAVFVLFFSLNAMAQVPVDQTTGKARYEEVVTVSGANQAELFKRLDHWFNTFYKNPTSVVENKDEAGGKIKGKHRIDLFTIVPNQPKAKKGLEYYTIEVAVKDGRYKYVIDDIFFHNVPKIYIESWMTDKASANEKDWVKQTHVAISEVIESLKKTLAEPLGKKGEESW